MNFMHRLAWSAGVLAAVAGAQAQDWRSNPFVPKASNPALTHVSKMATFSVNPSEVRNVLSSAPHEDVAHEGRFVTIELPKPDGTVGTYKIWRYDMLSPEIAEETGFTTYRGTSIDNNWAEVRLDMTALGFRGMVMSAEGNYFIEPLMFGNHTYYASYWKKDNMLGRCENPCKVVDSIDLDLGDNPLDGPGDTLKTTRLALNGTIEYTAFYGSVANAQAGATTSVNRCNGVYERDVSIRMNIVRLNCFTGTDPFTNNNGGTMLGQNQTQCDLDPGNANYDIGHVFSTGGGGIAGLGVVGVTGSKARGVTGSGAPIGDAFDIDYVAHEMGHQYGANHTFNSTLSSCGGGNRSAGAAYEVGSGTTIMAYAGICGAENVQSNSDAYFHYKSIEEIWAWRNSGTGAATGTNTATGNSTPTVEAGANFTIPQGTAYKLTAVGSDPNAGDALYYCWEQYNLGTATTDPSQFSTGPLVRSRNPVTSPVRFVPQVTTSFNNPTGDVWEKLANTNRTMLWRATVRDRNVASGTGGYATDTMTITVSGTAFTVTAPAAAAVFNGGSTTNVTWTVGGGSVAANVRILFVTSSTNYQNGTVTVLSASTPNDGSETVTLPNVSTTTGRIVVEAVGNIFYDVNPGNFTVNMVNNPVPVLVSISPNSSTAGGSSFTLTCNGGNYVTGSKVRWNGVDLTTTYVSATQLTASVPAANIASPGSATVTVFNPTPGGGTSAGRTFTINPPAPQIVNPNSFTIVTGTPFGGVLSDLFSSDNSYLYILNDENDPNANIEFTGVSPWQTLSVLKQLVETNGTRNDLNQFTEMFNWTTNNYELVDTRVSTLGDTAFTVTISTNPSRFVQSGSRNLKSRIRWIPQADLEAGDGWSEALDRMVWEATF